MEWALIAGLILTNACWAAYSAYRERSHLETVKLVASKTIGEYSWLKKMENSTQAPREEVSKREGYDSVWEDDDG